MSFVLLLGLVSAFNESPYDFSYPETTNYSLVNVNNSQFLGGYTWTSNPYYQWWYNMTIGAINWVTAQGYLTSSNITTPRGVNGSVQFNDNGLFNGTSLFWFDKNNRDLYNTGNVVNEYCDGSWDCTSQGQTTCEAQGENCYWSSNDFCSGTPDCYSIGDEGTCESQTPDMCYWNVDYCEYSDNCENYGDQSSCEGVGCFWTASYCEGNSGISCGDTAETEGECDTLSGCSWLQDLNSSSVTTGQFIAQANSTTSPIVTTSTLLCNNLNADLWDGYQFSDYFNQVLKTSSTPEFNTIKITTSGSNSGAVVVRGTSDNKLYPTSMTYDNTNGKMSYAGDMRVTANYPAGAFYTGSAGNFFMGYNGTDALLGRSSGGANLYVTGYDMKVQNRVSVGTNVDIANNLTATRASWLKGTLSVGDVLNTNYKFYILDQRANSGYPTGSYTISPQVNEPNTTHIAIQATGSIVNVNNSATASTYPISISTSRWGAGNLTATAPQVVGARVDSFNYASGSTNWIAGLMSYYSVWHTAGTGIVTNMTDYLAWTPSVAYGNITNKYGFYSKPQTGARITNAYGFYQEGASDTNYFAGNTTFDGRVLLNDNKKLLLGTGLDASFYYNATDVIINPKEVGTGKIYIQGDIINTGNITTQGKVGKTQSFRMLNSSSSTCYMNFTSGILTWSNC
jgi:hypothetical protein